MAAGAVNQAGLDFYSRLVDGLLEAGITPVRHPLPLGPAAGAAGSRAAGPTRATAEAFVEYADVVSRHLGDRVKNWITHNEPWCVSFLSHQIGAACARLATIGTRPSRAAHHVLLSHGWAVPVIRAQQPRQRGRHHAQLRVGRCRLSRSAADADRHQRWYDGYFNRWFCGPGLWPPLPGRHGGRHYAARRYLPKGLDFVPARRHGRHRRADRLPGRQLLHARASCARTRREAICRKRSSPTRATLRAHGHGLGDLSRTGSTTCSAGCTSTTAMPKLYVTENGCSYADGPGADGAHARRAGASTICASTSLPCTAPCGTACRWRATSSGR